MVPRMFRLRFFFLATVVLADREFLVYHNIICHTCLAACILFIRVHRMHGLAVCAAMFV